MDCRLPVPHEPRSIHEARLHRRLASACAGMAVSAALIVSICAIALLAGTGASHAAARNLIPVDDGISLGGMIAVFGIIIVLMLLAPFALNGLTPSHVRRRRARR